MSQGDYRAALVEIHGYHSIVWHRLDQRDSRDVPGLGVFLARIADRHLVVESDGNLSEIFRKLPGANDQHAIARSMHGRQYMAVEREGVGGIRGTKRHESSIEIELARHQRALLDRVEQFAYATIRRQVLQHQLKPFR